MEAVSRPAASPRSVAGRRRQSRGAHPRFRWRWPVRCASGAGRPARYRRFGEWALDVAYGGGLRTLWARIQRVAVNSTRCKQGAFVTSFYVADPGTFRQGEDIAIAVCVGRFGSDLRCTQELYTRCVQHSGARDIWTDAYHALHRNESAQLVSHDGAVTATRPGSTTRRHRVTHVTCFVEQERAAVQIASARFTVSVDSVGRVRGEAVATGRRAKKIARLRVDPFHSASEIGLAVLLHLASLEYQPAVADIMRRIRREDPL